MTKILIIDDSEQVRYFLSQIFEKQGFDVFVAIDGEQGAAMYKICQPDMVFCDIEMPNMNGIELAKHIHEHHNDSVTLMTSTPLHLIPEKYFSAKGVCRLIHKSAFADDLMDVINNHIKTFPERLNSV